MRYLWVPVCCSNQTSVAGMAASLATNAPRAEAFFAENSFGKLALDVVVTPVVQIAAASPVLSGSSGIVTQQADPILASLGFPRPQGEKRAYFMTTRGDSMLGISTGNDAYVWTLNEPVAWHEMGHTLGLTHVASITVGTWAGNVLTLPKLSVHTGASFSSNNDASTTMGYQWGRTHFGANDKALLTWLTPLAHPQGADATYTLTPLASPSGSALRIQCSQWDYNSKRVLWLEYRQPIGFDQPYFSANAANAGIVMRIAGDFGIPPNCPVMRHKGRSDSAFAFQPGDRITVDGAFTIEVTGPGQVRIRDVDGFVPPVLPLPPVINAFTADPPTLPAGGGPVTIAHNVTNAQTVTIDGTPSSPAGSMRPTVVPPRTFTLVAHGLGQDVTRTLTVGVTGGTPPPPPPPQPTGNAMTKQLALAAWTALDPAHVTQAQKDALIAYGSQLTVEVVAPPAPTPTPTPTPSPDVTYLEVGASLTDAAGYKWTFGEYVEIRYGWYLKVNGRALRQALKAALVDGKLRAASPSATPGVLVWKEFSGTPFAPVWTATTAP